MRGRSILSRFATFDSLVLFCLLLIVISSGCEEEPDRSQNTRMLEFVLRDAFGRKVHSQDYKGVPIFLEFGACW